jgi:MFS family permease
MIESRQRSIALLVAGCFFMENLDGTIVTTAAPRIGRALHVPSTSVGLVIAAYLVTLAVLIPLSGWMTSRWGTRRVFLSAIVIFTASSLACALSTNLAELVAFRWRLSSLRWPPICSPVRSPPAARTRSRSCCWR